MKLILVLIVVASFIGVWNVSVAEEEPALADKLQESLQKLEKINVKELMKKRAVIMSYFKCAFDTGPCDALGANFKELYTRGFIHANLLQDCHTKMTARQRAQLILIFKYINKFYPEQYQESINKYLNGNEPEDVTAFFQEVTL